MALHLLDLALQQEGARRTATATAVTRLAAAAALDVAEAALAALRQQHPQTPADVAALAVALRQATVAQRQALATLHTQAALATAAAAHERAQLTAQTAAAALAQAQARLVPARAAHERRRAVIDDALTQPPLDTLAADAAAVLAGPAFVAASTRINNALPAALRNRARERAAQAAALAQARAPRLDAAQSALGGERTVALVGDPGGNLAAMVADATNHPTLVAARATFDAAQTAYDNAETAYTAGMRQTLAEWQAEVPEALWSEAATLWAAQDTLQALQTAPGALVNATTAAEAALLAALEADAPVQQRRAVAAEILASESGLAQALARSLPEQAAAALRGALVSAPWLQA